MRRFTIRDWFWLCIVLALAIGWGSHFRYTQWVETNMSTPIYMRMDEADLTFLRKRADDAETESHFLRKKLEWANDRSLEIQYAMAKGLTDEQIKQFETLQLEYRQIEENR